jgi:hypothetical protein
MRRKNTSQTNNNFIGVPADINNNGPERSLEQMTANDIVASSMNMTGDQKGQ